MYFLNKKPTRRYNKLPDFFYDLAHEESRTYMIASYDKYEVQYIKEVAQYYRLELYMQLGTMKETDYNYLKFYRHVKTIEDHIKAITENERALEKICMQLMDKLGDNFLKTKSELEAAK